MHILFGAQSALDLRDGPKRLSELWGLRGSDVWQSEGRCNEGTRIVSGGDSHDIQQAFDPLF